MKGPIAGGNSGGGGDDLSPGELRVLLDGMSRVMEHAFDQLDGQTRALDRLAAAVEALEARSDVSEAAHAAASPDRVAAATAKAVRDALVPHLLKIVSVMEELNGGKAILRERLRAFDREEARQGRWRFQPWAVVVGIPLVLVTVLTLLVPRAAAETPFTCRVAGGEWWGATEDYPAACMFSTEGRE